MRLNFSILQLWRAYQSRCDQVWIWFKKFTLFSTKRYMNKANCMHLSGRYSMSKLVNNRGILYFWTAVLAEPSDQNSGHTGQNSLLSSSKFSTKPNPTAWILDGEKSWAAPPSLQSKTNTYQFFLAWEITGKNTLRNICF